MGRFANDGKSGSFKRSKSLIGICLRYSFLAAFALLIPSFPIQNAQAAVLASLQSGTATIANGSASTTATITSVDITKSFVVCSTSLGSDVTSSPNYVWVSCQLTNATTVTFARVSTVGTITIQWYVAYFSSGVSVQRGSTTLTTATTNITLTAVTLANSFPITSFRDGGTVFNGNDFYSAAITTTTNLQVVLSTAPSTNTVLEWQVVQYTNSSVQSGTVSFATTDSSKTATVTSVDTTKSWLICTYDSAAGVTGISQKMVEGVLTNSTTLTFTRLANGQTISLHYYLVTFTDGTTVQNGTTAFGTTDTTLNATISSVDLTRTIAAPSSFQRGGQTSYAADDQPAPGWFTTTLSSATNLQLTRGNPLSSTANVSWFVVQFPAPQAFGYMKNITIDRTKVGVSGTSATTLSNFPFLFNVTDANLATTAHSGHVTSANGYDIMFRGVDNTTCGGANSCTLDYEVESYNGTTGALTAWVRIPSLNTNAASSNTTIRIYYGNSDITSSIQNPTGVWDTNYKAVWHLSDNGNTTVNDSTSNNDDGTAAANTSTKTTAGQIASALTFNGTSDYIYTTTQFTNPQGFTTSAWFKTSTASGHKIVGFESNQTGTASANYDRMLYMGTDGKVYAAAYNGQIYTATSTNTLADGNWHYVVGSFLDTGNVLKLYVDGLLNNSTTVGGYENSTGYWRMGSYKLTGWTAAADGYFTGTIDETHISSTIRNADWIITEYCNQSPSTCPNFYNVGAEQAAPITLVKLKSFSAVNYSGLVQLKWETGYEVDNLGFRIYREGPDGLIRVTPSMIAGSALLAKEHLPLTSGRTYAWQDFVGGSPRSLRYWLEDVDTKLNSTWHGPFLASIGDSELPQQVQSVVLSYLGKGASKTQGTLSNRTESLSDASDTVSAEESPREAQVRTIDAAALAARDTSAQMLAATSSSSSVQLTLAANPAVKILVKQAGWYRVTQPQLVQAGLSASANPQNLRLYAEGVEQYFIVHTCTVSTPKCSQQFNPGDWIEFYGTGLNVPYTDTRVYWLVPGTQAGKRISTVSGASRKTGIISLSATMELDPKTIYWSGLLNGGDQENFFGSVISSTADLESLQLNHLDQSANKNAQLQIGLQGVSATSHSVQIQLNGTTLGSLNFNQQTAGSAKFTVPSALLRVGENDLTLVALNGDNDISLLSYIQISYQRTLNADQDFLSASLSGNQVLTATGFTSPVIRVIDISNPAIVKEITGTIVAQGNGYSINASIAGTGTHNFIIFADTQIQSAAGVETNNPSAWNKQVNGADVIIISHPDFLASLQPLKAQQQAEGYTVALADADDIYDEFNYGEKTPYALKNFIAQALANWTKKPRFLLLVGDASFDPKNYLGMGDFDFLPTKFVDTSLLETASDDWFGDINNNGYSEIAVGRLSVRTPAEAALQAAKIVAYRQSAPGAAWTKNLVLVSDFDPTFDFEGASDDLLSATPPSMSVSKIYRSQMNDATAYAQVLQSFNSGALLINYFGHGSVEIWRGDLLQSNDAPGLTNSTKLPFVVAMTCLNGFFHDIYTNSLAEALMNAPNGGAVGVWASSGLTDSDVQHPMNKELLNQLFNSSQTIGEAVVKAKASESDPDVRKTWILFGDPTLKIVR